MFPKDIIDYLFGRNAMNLQEFSGNRPWRRDTNEEYDRG